MGILIFDLVSSISLGMETKPARQTRYICQGHLLISNLWEEIGSYHKCARDI